MSYQARMCVKDSFVKCWQQPQQALPSQSSPPTRPGARQGSLAWPGLGVGPPGRAVPWEMGHSEAVPGAGTLSTTGTSPPLAPGTPW